MNLFKRIGYKNLLLIALINIFIGCAQTQKSAKAPLEPVVDPTLPIIKEIKTISEITSIALEWKNTDDPRVMGYYIYRTSPIKKDKLRRIAKVEDRYSSHHYDTNLDPDTTYHYQISSYDNTGHESKIEYAKRATTLRRLHPVAYIKAISNLPRRIKILWRPHQDKTINRYILQKGDALKSKFTNLATIDNRLHVEYIDNDLKDDTIYSYRLIGVDFNGVKTDPTKIVEAKTKPVPHTVLNIKATTDQPRKITIKWQKSTQDIDYYRVYRTSKPNDKYKPLVRLYETEFTDKIQQDGKIYYYKITVVDKYGLESKKSILVKGQTLTKPATPHFTKVGIENNSAVTAWLPNDGRTKSYILTKITHKGWSKNTQEFQLDTKTYKDDNIIQGTKYGYVIQSVDKYGLVSLPSNEAEITFPKGSSLSK